jgi:hypothetical protein
VQQRGIGAHIELTAKSPRKPARNVSLQDEGRLVQQPGIAEAIQARFDSQEATSA